MIRTFGISMLLTIAALLTALIVLGPTAALTTIVLIAIELAFSFDNAIVNAKVLVKLSPLWQRLFLTVGVALAIVGVRVVLPVLIVALTAHLSWGEVIDDMLHHPTLYAEHLADAHVAIASFGGSFLLVLALYFLFDSDRDVLWWKRFEGPLVKVPGDDWWPPVVASIAVVALSFFDRTEQSTILTAGLLGVASYVAIKLFIDIVSRLAPTRGGMYTGWAAFGAFIYLQLLDASFSLDGVLGAFALTDKVILIALGLGVGAIWVRSLTVYIARQGTLQSYRFLEHGAHYAILVLAIALLSSIFYEIPNMITGAVGIAIIGASFYGSKVALQKS